MKGLTFFYIYLYRYIYPLEFNTEHLIDGVKVTLLEANHCPGAALIHFSLPNDQCYLHTGDFRACKAMQAYHLLVNQRVNVLYLDTTYCDPKYRYDTVLVLYRSCHLVTICNVIIGFYKFLVQVPFQGSCTKLCCQNYEEPPQNSSQNFSGCWGIQYWQRMCISCNF